MRITPIGNKILVLPIHRDAVDRQLIAAMRSENAGDFVQKLAEEIAPIDPGKIVLVKTEPPVCGRVVALGKPFCEECKRAISVDISVGDVVVYHKMSGMEIGIDDVAHVMLKPHDVLLIWRPDPKES